MELENRKDKPVRFFDYMRADSKHGWSRQLRLSAVLGWTLYGACILAVAYSLSGRIPLADAPYTERWAQRIGSAITYAMCAAGFRLWMEWRSESHGKEMARREEVL